MAAEHLVGTARGRRAEVVEQTEHSSRMEGLETTAEFKSDAQAYVDGTIDLDELGRRTQVRYSRA